MFNKSFHLLENILISQEIEDLLLPLQITESQSVSISSKMLARISKVPYLGSNTDNVIYKHEVVTTVLPPKPEEVPDIVPLWVVVLSAAAGAVILLLLIFLLYKVIISSKVRTRY